MDKRTIDIITTLALGIVPFIVWLIALMQNINIPIQYVMVVSLVLAFLSQYTSNQRVKEAEETVKKWIRYDYLTTILLTAWPYVLFFQPQIMAQIPVAYAGIGTFIFMVLSQWAAEEREKQAQSIPAVPTEA